RRFFWILLIAVSISFLLFVFEPFIPRVRNEQGTALDLLSAEFWVSGYLIVIAVLALLQAKPRPARHPLYRPSGDESDAILTKERLRLPICLILNSKVDEAFNLLDAVGRLEDPFRIKSGLG